ncbi:uncharacterized protein LOC129613705 [Condylostylus longicornis]|uniref:uncharacterized protein LOC129613705 n=1 Tax=Condylostylus longicornis TaxID=2530218 RepID=UPI00244E3922|nr:uncharacterized protein LOC129613705 [Condylostylus longicornis]XP_055383854.1 uncharacterized protein LOC129613705 [Condylostylus longicornis]XP_055383855.1 uncharacterized protein LOC129613705 [Condylostylus longicornis]
MCRCCQSCLEDLYWNCIEEKFCFDKSIAEYNPDEDEFVTKNNIKIIANGQDNNNKSPIRSQPMKRNESTSFSNAKIHEEDVRREIQTSVPILAPEILAVFNNSQIFQESQKLSRTNTKSGITPIHTPTSTRNKYMASEQKKLIFHLEGNAIEITRDSTKSVSTITDNQINETAVNTTRDKKIKFTIADNSPLELVAKSPNAYCPIIPENDEDEIDDATISEIVLNNTKLCPNINSHNQSKNESNKSSIETIEASVDGSESNINDEVILRPKFIDDISFANEKSLFDHKPLRNVYSMPYVKTPAVRTVSSETDIFSITASGLYGQLSMTPEVPSISFAHLPKNYEDTPTVEKYKETITLYKLQTANKERADSQIVDYSMPRYFKKTLAHSNQNLEDYAGDLKSTHSKGGSKENVNIHNSNKKLERSKRLKQLRGNLPPLIIVHRHHQKKEDIKNTH